MPNSAHHVPMVGPSITRPRRKRTMATLVVPVTNTVAAASRPGAIMMRVIHSRAPAFSMMMLPGASNRKIAPEEYARGETEIRDAHVQITARRQGGETDIDAVDAGQETGENRYGQQAPVEFSYSRSAGSIVYASCPPRNRFPIRVACVDVVVKAGVNARMKRQRTASSACRGGCFQGNHGFLQQSRRSGRRGRRPRFPFHFSQNRQVRPALRHPSRGWRRTAAVIAPARLRAHPEPLPHGSGY